MTARRVLLALGVAATAALAALIATDQPRPDRVPEPPVTVHTAAPAVEFQEEP